MNAPVRPARPLPLALLVSLLGLAPLAASAAPATAAAGPATLPPEIREASGLAASRREPGLVWVHEDSGRAPVLTALDAATGRPRGRWRLEGARAVDWEDMASFTLDGRACLLVADVGDNRANRGDCTLYIVAEPEAGPPGSTDEQTLPVAWRLPVIFPDGPRDVEAVAVDARAERVYLLAKRETPHALHALRLRPGPPGQPVPPPERVGELGAFPAALGAQALLPVPAGAFRAQPTAMDFAADGSAALILTYGDVLLYPRKHDEPWSAALARAPRRLAAHGLAQAEAAAFSADGSSVLVTGEGTEVPLRRYPLAGR